ncbi:major facilitator transporter [Afipia sp. P52-10]|uniref:MFS transporter n=1 Tax=Afipia sp. P52-10 TaxID=1429916 RepID=UPI0003DF15DD|nr:MFS transporter [Afipia sp. P52-10]ETR75276.1 major facilitator transporter [Afipia sp. P52-10]
MQYLLPIIATASFAGSLSVRAMDPVLPQVASELLVTIQTAAMLASAFAFTFAMIQPALGMVADAFGKPKLIFICLILLGAANIVGAFSTSFEVLLVTRVLAGIGGGGVMPVTLGLVGDIFPIQQRQVAMGRVLAGAMAGNLLGATFSGLIGDHVGWRGVLVVMGALVLAASAAVGWGFRHQMRGARKPTDIATIIGNYRSIFAHPHARVCYPAVFIEGSCVLGLFPFVAAFLADLGEPRLSIAGIVIAGFAVGGLVYSTSVARLLPWLGEKGLMIGGGLLVASQLVIVALGPPWQAQIVNFVVMGCGFYMIHGSLQTFASEISVEARGTAVGLHAFHFFLGQTAGPLAYGFGVSHLGKVPTLLFAAAIMLLLGIACAHWLRHRHARVAEDKPAQE